MPVCDAPLLRRKDRLRFYQAPQMEATNQVVHAFTSREGGVSRPPFDSLNLGLKTGDEVKHVEANRHVLARTFGFEYSALVTVNQVHQDNILVIDALGRPNPARASCDAIVTNRRGIAVGVLTADCVPILLFDPEHRAVAAVHAGWKGTARDLAGKTVGTLRRLFRTRPGTLLASVGPAIGACCYEVGGEVRDAFLRRPRVWSEWTKSVSGTSWMLNLCQANADLLLQAGVQRENITVFDTCTHCEADLFYSYRRDGERTGRQIGFIMLK